MDELLKQVLQNDCIACEYILNSKDSKECKSCKHGGGVDGYDDNYKPSEAVKELDRLIKLGRRYDHTDEELANSKMEKYRNEK